MKSLILVLFFIFLNLKASGEKSVVNFSKASSYRIIEAMGKDIPHNFLQTINHKIQSMVKQGYNISINSKLELEPNPEQGILHYLAQKDKYQFIKLLAKKGYKGSIDLNLRSRFNESPLHIAASENSEMSAVYLINLGADVNLVSNFQETPLQIAIKKNFVDLAEVFLKNKAHLNHLSDDQLHEFINELAEKDYKMIHLVLLHKANFKIQTNKEGRSIYHLLLINKRFDVFRKVFQIFPTPLNQRDYYNNDIMNYVSDKNLFFELMDQEKIFRSIRAGEIKKSKNLKTRKFGKIGK